jgi:hypothetical protein
LSANPEAVVVQQPINKQISADRRELVLTKLADEYCLWRIYPAGFNRVDLYLHRTAGTAACQQLTRVASAK